MRRMVEKSSTIRNFMSVGGVLMGVLVGAVNSAWGVYREIGADTEGGASTAAARDDRALLLLEHLAAQAVGGNFEPDLRFERRELLAVRELALEVVLEPFQPLELGAPLGRLERLQVHRLAARLVVARLHLAALARQVDAAALDHVRRVARAAAARQRHLERRVEEIGDAL